MNVIRELGTNRIIFVGCNIDESGVRGAGWSAPGITTAVAEQISVNELPDDFIMGASTYDGESWGFASNSIDQRKSYIIDKINTKRDILFWSNVPHDDTAFQFRNEFDRANLTNLQQYAARGNDVQVTMEDNTIRTFSSATFVALMDGVLVAKSSVSLGARQLKNQVMAAVSQAELDSIDLGVFG